MASRKREYELSVERPIGPDRGLGGTVRLTVRVELGPEGERPDPTDLAKELEGLTEELNALVGPALAAGPLGRPDRGLNELVDAYRPRQRELVDLLFEEGELTEGEHARLREYLAAAAQGRPGAPAPIPENERLIATVPIERASPGPSAPAAFAPAKAPEVVRPVAELLRTYQIASLRQAGAVRARRQISFAEYMALKRHFEPSDPASAPSTG